MLNASLIDVPRPFIDPINTFVEALGVVSMALQRPRIDSTIALLLDEQRRGLAMFRVPPLTSRSIHTVVAHCSEMPSTSSVVLVSSRRTVFVVPADIALLHLLYCHSLRSRYSSIRLGRHWSWWLVLPSHACWRARPVARLHFVLAVGARP